MPMPQRMTGSVPQPSPGRDAAHERHAHLHPVPPAPELSRWRQPRDADGQYVALERRALPALNSLRFFASFYIVLHHIVNVALLAAYGNDADRAGTWYLAWATEGHVGVTFFYVLGGFVLAWFYHAKFAQAPDESLPGIRSQFWFARFARVWPLHAVTFLAVLPTTVLGFTGGRDAIAAAWQAPLNLLLLHSWVPTGAREGLASTFNAPSWSLSCQAFFYAMFPLMAILLLRRLRWGMAQLALLGVGLWIGLGVLGVALGTSDLARWAMTIFPPVRFIDFSIGVVLGLLVVQGKQRTALRGTAPTAATSSGAWTLLEATLFALTCLAPLAWSQLLEGRVLDTLSASWFYQPVIAALIVTFALERGALSRRWMRTRTLLWLGELSFALFLTHLAVFVAGYHAGLFDRLGILTASTVLVAVSFVVAWQVHVRFEQPARARLVAWNRARTAPR